MISTPNSLVTKSFLGLNDDNERGLCIGSYSIFVFEVSGDMSKSSIAGTLQCRLTLLAIAALISERRHRIEIWEF